jgi:hypothetical protein
MCAMDIEFASLRFSYFILQLFQQCGNFCSHFFFSVLKKTQNQYILLNMSWYCFFWFYYLQLLVVMLLPWLFVITGCVTSVIRRVQLVEQELHILPAHLSFLVQWCEILWDFRVKRWYYLSFALFMVSHYIISIFKVFLSLIYKKSELKNNSRQLICRIDWQYEMVIKLL